MELELWQIFLIAAYFWYAGVNAEFNHNYTCNLPLSILLSLVWPLMFFVPRPKSMPKYYREGHYKKDL